MSASNLKDLIKSATIKAISSYCERKIADPERKFQILDILMPKERLIRSVIGGMETSLGRTLWEPLAKAIAATNGFTVVAQNLQAPANMPASLANGVTGILEDRFNNRGVYDGKSAHEEIKKLCQPFLKTSLSFQKAPTGFGVDVWLQKDGVDYFFDTKTVQPNIGDYKSFLTQILNWYAYYYAGNPQGKAEGRIVFPYNPYNGKDFWKNTKGGGKPLEARTEGWVEDEFWDFISGEKNTFNTIKDCLKEINTAKTLESKLDVLFNRKKEQIVQIAMENLE